MKFEQGQNFQTSTRIGKNNSEEGLLLTRAY